MLRNKAERIWRHAWSGAPVPAQFLHGTTALERQRPLVFQVKQCRNCYSLGESGGQRGPAPCHFIEHTSFLTTGLLFWWPVIEPWPSAARWPRWSILLYLFLATLPCDVLSALLVFSDRVVYPMYLSMPRMGGLSPLEDQECAAALMWTCVTVVFLVAETILSLQLLSPKPGIREGVSI